MHDSTILAAINTLRDTGPSALNWLFLVESLVVVIIIIFVSRVPFRQFTSGYLNFDRML